MEAIGTRFLVEHGKQFKSIKRGTLPSGIRCSPKGDRHRDATWVAVKELELSYHIGENLLLSIYSQYGKLI